MALNDLAFSVEGKQSDLSARRFIDLVSTSLEILWDLDSAISSRRRGTVSWVIGELKYGSPAVMTTGAESGLATDTLRAMLPAASNMSGSSSPPSSSSPSPLLRLTLRVTLLLACRLGALLGLVRSVRSRNACMLESHRSFAPAALGLCARSAAHSSSSRVCGMSA